MPPSPRQKTPDPYPTPTSIQFLSSPLSYIIQMMKSNKEVSSILANITEMVLQARISPTPQQLLRIETVRSEIEVLRSHMSPSDEVLYFLIDRQYYQIRNKITASLRRNTLAPLTLLLTFTLFDKETSLAETAQIWKIQLIRKQVTTLRPTECTKELLLLIREVTGQLTSPYPFSEATRNKDTNKKYVIDFKVDLWAADQPTKGKYFQRDYRMKECRGRMNELFQLRVGCYWRENIPIIPFVLSTSAGGKGRKASEQTRGDSGSIGSQKDMPMKKYRSIDEQQQAFQFYDPELDVTILSSDSDSLSHSRKVMNELTVGEVDEFQLLIEEDTDEDEMFVMQNEGNFQNWQKYLLLNFH